MEYIVIRLLCGFFSGVLLSFSGSLVQLATRNILASPSTLGFDGLSILWLILFHSISLSLGIESPFWSLLAGTPCFILLGLVFSRLMKSHISLERIILLGLTFNLLVGAIFSLWQFFFMAFNLPFPIEVWFGHFRHSSLASLLPLMMMVVVIIIGFQKLKLSLHLYSLGPAFIQNFKLKIKQLFAFLYIGSVLCTFMVVSFFGAFAFLGLIFPIIARKIFFKEYDLEGEFYFGALLNGLVLMAIDFLCYFSPILGAEIPVGLLVTAVGAVSLILLLWKAKDPSGLLAK